MCQPLAVNGPLAMGLGYSPRTFNTPPTRMAWHGSEAFHRFEIQHRINSQGFLYVNVLPHLTLNVHRRSGAVSAIYENIQANGYRENIFGDGDLMRKRVWKQRKNTNLFLITKYFQHQLTHAPLSL